MLKFKEWLQLTESALDDVYLDFFGHDINLDALKKNIKYMLRSLDYIKNPDDDDVYRAIGDVHTLYLAKPEKYEEFLNTENKNKTLIRDIQDMLRLGEKGGSTIVLDPTRRKQKTYHLSALSTGRRGEEESSYDPEETRSLSTPEFDPEMTRSTSELEPDYDELVKDAIIERANEFRENPNIKVNQLKAGTDAYDVFMKMYDLYVKEVEEKGMENITFKIGKYYKIICGSEEPRKECLKFPGLAYNRFNNLFQDFKQTIANVLHDYAPAYIKKELIAKGF
jgi:hypothetical protein